MKKNILAIAGRPGLYTLVSQGRGMLIVEAIDDTRRRMPAGARDRVTSLNDVSMYTNGDDVPLMQVFASIKAKYNAAPVDFDYNKKVYDELPKAGIDFPFPQMDVHVHNTTDSSPATARNR